MKTLILLLFLVLTGCTTVDFVRKDLTPHKQAVLRYEPTSNPKTEEKYRAKLNEQSTNFCGGNYSIVKEYEALTETPRSSGVTTGVGTGFGTGRRGMGFGFGGLVIGAPAGSSEKMYHFVEIDCGEKAPPPAPSATPMPSPAT